MSSDPLPKCGNTSRAGGRPRGAATPRSREVSQVIPQAVSIAPPAFWGGAPGASALPCITTHPISAREFGLPPAVRGTLPTQHQEDVSKLVPRQPQLPLPGAMAEELVLGALSAKCRNIFCQPRQGRKPHLTLGKMTPRTRERQTAHKGLGQRGTRSRPFLGNPPFGPVCLRAFLATQTTWFSTPKAWHGLSGRYR